MPRYNNHQAISAVKSRKINSCSCYKPTTNRGLFHGQPVGTSILIVSYSFFSSLT